MTVHPSDVTVNVDGVAISRTTLVREIARRLREDPTPEILETAARQLESFLESEATSADLLKRSMAMIRRLLGDVT